MPSPLSPALHNYQLPHRIISELDLATPTDLLTLLHFASGRRNRFEYLLAAEVRTRLLDGKEGGVERLVGGADVIVPEDRGASREARVKVKEVLKEVCNLFNLVKGKAR
jgi:hypothetical protein